MIETLIIVVVIDAVDDVATSVDAALEGSDGNGGGTGVSV